MLLGSHAEKNVAFIRNIISFVYIRLDVVYMYVISVCVWIPIDLIRAQAMH